MPMYVVWLVVAVHETGESGMMPATYFAALVFVALSLGPSLAHLLALPNKIYLDQADYFVVQNICRGWALLAFLCVAGAHAVFWTWTCPANVATKNWTVVPANWEVLRTQWEFSHAGGAVLNWRRTRPMAGRPDSNQGRAHDPLRGRRQVPRGGTCIRDAHPARDLCRTPWEG
jgi:hypothetical protein